MDAGEARTLGALLRKIRFNRDLTLEVVAGRAGISAGFLSRIERGEAVLDRLSHWHGVADALGVPLSDLLRLPMPVPGNGHTDSATEAIRDALNAVEVGHPGGEVLSVQALQRRVTKVHRLNRQCRFKDVGLALPGLIRDLHTTLGAGRDLDVLLPLAVLLHVHVTRRWLNYAEAPADLRRQDMFVARDLAREHNKATSLASAAHGLAETLIVDGAFKLAQVVVDEITLPPVTVKTAGLVCATLAGDRALLIAAKDDDPSAPLAEAAEIADRFGELGETDPLGFDYGPTKVAIRGIRVSMELGEVDEAVRVARAVDPERNPFRASQAWYWRETGRALAQAGEPVDQAVHAYLRAEALNPVKLYRNLRTREVLRELRTRAPNDEQLQRLARRADLDQR